MDVTYDNLIHTTFHGFASFAVISTIANYGWLHVSAGKFFMAATALSPARGHPLISLPVTKCLCATNPSCLPRELI
ncbi:hypothetical protein Pdw03_7504 [Penicillium digitatum]|uniref:Uncharacterized protein n=1 Tax=Penicillium digitatum TaxID=36651 RepID=A0A7T6XM98_PENDI|nr:hypothetical protein Pdw03_7504 [Penicillium digitatum]